MSWRDDARCLNTDTAAFYPDKGSSTYWARKICDPCPVKEPCLQFALETRDPHGFWGGMSPRQRKPLLAAMPSREKELPDRCVNGHDWTAVGVMAVASNGRRWCRKCNAARKRNADRLRRAGRMAGERGTAA